MVGSGKGSVVLAVATLLLTACGGGDGEAVADPTPLQQCASAGVVPKIRGGTPCALPGQTPIVVFIATKNDGSGLYCSGTLISPTRILTAAHCLPSDVARVTTPVWQPDGTARALRASSWVTHPEYQQTQAGFLNDAAVITLSNPLPAPPMPLLVSNPSAAGQSVFIAGWGGPANELAAGFSRITIVNPLHVGYTYDGKGANTCPGDSGGPMYRAVGGTQGVVGITSSGTSADCNVGDMSLFTNIQTPKVLDFIRTHAPDAVVI
jgi:secreted trypsin-like serine protease